MLLHGEVNGVNFVPFRDQVVFHRVDGNVSIVVGDEDVTSRLIPFDCGDWIFAGSDFIAEPGNVRVEYVDEKTFLRCCNVDF